MVKEKKVADSNGARTGGGLAARVVVSGARAPLDHDRRQSVAKVIDALIRPLGARYALFVTVRPQGRRFLIGRWATGSWVGRPDKLLHRPHLERVLDAAPAWVLDRRPRGNWRAGVALPAERENQSAILLSGSKTPPHWMDDSTGVEHGASLASLLEMALDVARLRDENRHLQDSLKASQQNGCREAAESALLEFPLRGLPARRSIPELKNLFPEFLTASLSMYAVLHGVAAAARTDIPVLIEGESGTGKELIARAIHRLGRRSSRPFVWENCGAIAANLAESEFFGHIKGAFTGATYDKKGLFERGEGGTVFLDEVGEMDLAMQKRLLRVLQEKEVRRVGDHKVEKIDFRVISATNRILEQQVLVSRFRKDLYYRLNVITVSVPPLRERPEDVLLLVDHFNARFSQEAEKPLLDLPPDTLSVLQAYPWPGNVRELRNEMERLCQDDERSPGPEALTRRILRDPAVVSGRAECAAERPLEQLEREVLGIAILGTLQRARGNRSEAARRLGISRPALYRRMERYGLQAFMEPRDDSCARGEG